MVLPQSDMAANAPPAPPGPFAPVKVPQKTNSPIERPVNVPLPNDAPYENPPGMSVTTLPAPPENAPLIVVKPLLSNVSVLVTATSPAADKVKSALPASRVMSPTTVTSPEYT